jgi:hypothetical protein
MKLRVLAAAGTALALSIGAMASVAGADTFTPIPVRPYVFGLVGVGTTNPGAANSDLCLVAAHDYGGGTYQYNGKINGTVVSGRAGELDVDFSAPIAGGTPSTCVPTDITVKPNDAANIGIQGTKPGGTLQISTITSIQSGILAGNVTTVRVHYSAGQSVKLPSGSALVAGDLANPAGGSADIALKLAVVTSKSVLNLNACSDTRKVIDTNTPDGSKSNAPTASDLGATGAPSATAAGVYVATIRECAQSTTPVDGKATTTKISIVGAGTASVDFLSASTVNPQTWDTTRGSGCSAVKTAVVPQPSPAVSGSTPLSASRVLQCKGDWGAVIPFTIAVRNWIASGTGFKDSFGLLHPGNPVTILTHTFS